jgi:hypothetical protein
MRFVVLCVAVLALLAVASARVGNHRHNNDLSGAKITGFPTWNVTYNPQQSTIFMPCNFSGYFDPAFAVVIASWASPTRTMSRGPMSRQTSWHRPMSNFIGRNFPLPFSSSQCRAAYHPALRTAHPTLTPPHFSATSCPSLPALIPNPLRTPTPPYTNLYPRAYPQPPTPNPQPPTPAFAYS